MQIGYMTFDEFLIAKGHSVREAADRFRRDQTIIGRYRRREINPSPEVMAEMWSWSQGEITPPEMLAVRPAQEGVGR